MTPLDLLWLEAQDLAAIALRRTGGARRKRLAAPTEPRADSVPEGPA